jgi:competence protein ComEC
MQWEGRRLDLSPHPRRKVVVLRPRVDSRRSPLALLLLSLLLLASRCALISGDEGSLGGPSPPPSGSLSVSFIDVGQGDGVLVQAGGEDYLIDSGRAEEGPNVVDFLRGRGVEELEGIVVTNPPIS